MTNLINIIWKSKDRKLIFILFFVVLMGIYLCLDRPIVRGKDDTIEINGTLKRIERVLVYSKTLNKSERDSTYHIFLKEYPCKFQPSYFHYDSKDFYSNSHIGDKITLHIARQDKEDIKIPDKRIRSFSLTNNSKTYLSLDNGLSGFGKGLFELGMIFIPLIIMMILIIITLKNNNRPGAD